MIHTYRVAPRASPNRWPYNGFARIRAKALHYSIAVIFIAIFGIVWLVIAVRWLLKVEGRTDQPTTG
jgi:hypothetical protein